MFKAAAGVDIQHVPYKGSAPALTDLIAGQTQIMFDPLQSVLSNVQGGRLRAIAISSKLRSSVLPNVPTIAESGYNGFETTAWWGVFAPANLSADTAGSLIAASEQIVRSDAFRGRLEPLGVILRLSPAARLRIFSAASWQNGARPCGIPGRQSTNSDEAPILMKLNDEEQDILGGKFGALPQIALQHQKQVGEFFGAADFVPVTQAHIMADTESLGEAGVRWLEEAGGDRRWTAAGAHSNHYRSARHRFRKSGFSRSHQDDARSGAPRDCGFRHSRRDDDRYLHQLSDHPGADAQRACRLWRYRRGDFFQLGMWGALQFRRRTVRACRRIDRTHAALWLSSRRTAPRDSARPRRLHSRHAQRMGARSAR
jgi:hypothetical protein